MLGQRGVVPARAERDQDQQVDVARAEQHGEPGRGERGAQLAGEPRPGDAVGDARLGRAGVGARAAPRRGERRRAPGGDHRQQRAAAGRRPARAPRRAGARRPPPRARRPGRTGTRRASARAAARRAAGPAARSPPPAPPAPPPRGRSRRAGSPARARAAAPTRSPAAGPRRRTSPSALSPRSSARCTSAHADSARSSPCGPADVVDERAAGVLEHHRVADRRDQLGQDLGHAAALQDQLGEAAVDLLPAREQRELRVDDRAVDRLGDLDEAHRAVEGDDRNVRARTRGHHRRRHLAPARAQLDGQRRHPLVDQRRGPAAPGGAPPRPRPARSSAPVRRP